MNYYFKYFIFFTLLLFHSKNFGQANNDVEYRNEYFNSCLSNLESGELELALRNCHQVTLMPGNELLSSRAVKIRDSVLLVLKKELVHSLIGIWKSKKSDHKQDDVNIYGSDRFRYLSITKDSLFHFNTKQQLLRDEPLVKQALTFVPEFGHYIDYREIIHNNNYIYSYFYNPEKDILSLSPAGKWEPGNIKWGMASHPIFYEYKRF